MGPRLRTQGAAWPLALQESARIAPSSAGMKTKGIKTTQMRCFVLGFFMILMAILKQTVQVMWEVKMLNKQDFKKIEDLSSKIIEVLFCSRKITSTLKCAQHCINRFGRLSGQPRGKKKSTNNADRFNSENLRKQILTREEQNRGDLCFGMHR